MKRFLSLLVCSVMLIVITGCADKEYENKSLSAAEGSAFCSGKVLGRTEIVIETEPEPCEEVPEEPEEEVYVPSAFLRVDPNLPLPNPDLILRKYNDYPLGGTIESTEPITSVSVSIVHSNPEFTGSNKNYSVSYDPKKEVYVCDFYDSKRISSGKCLDDRVNFEKLSLGTYTFTVTVENTAERLVVYSDTFTVEYKTYTRLNASNFRNTYGCAYNFFGGDTEKFLFGYDASVSSHRISVDSKWKNTYITRTDLFGRPAYVHTEALPYVRKAFEYAENTYVRVRGFNSDSGIIRVADLVRTFDGAYLSRTVSGDDSYISHHALGTAIDFNGTFKPNNLSNSNREIIRREVDYHLDYYGIRTKNGTDYHDFLYTGSCDEFHNGVPYTVLNYLLYELAFYRAGFGWGYYFTTTCDAMHYTLTEIEASVHDVAGKGLRKVYVYE